MFLAKILVILSFEAFSAGLIYGFALILTLFVVTRLHHTLNLKYLDFFGVIVPQYSWILAYTTLVPTVHLIPLTFSIIDLLSVQVSYGALFLDSLLTRNVACKSDFFTGASIHFGKLGNLIETLIIFGSNLNLIKIRNKAVSVLHLFNNICVCVAIHYFVTYSQSRKNSQ